MKTYLSLISLFTSYILTSQTIDKQVVASAGNIFTNSSTKLIYTIGEPIIGNINNTLAISQGFLATLASDITLSIEDALVNNTIKIYPNPVTESLSINLKKSDTHAKLYLYDISGKLVYTYTLNSVKNKINIHNLENGIYIIRLCFSENKKNKTFKVIKK